MKSTRILLLSTLAAAVLVGPRGAIAENPAKELKSRDVAVRLKAVDTLRDLGDDNAEALLLDALDDKDWEVVEKAARALATRGAAKSVKPLVSLALQGPIRRVRLAAVQSLAKLDPEAAANAFAARVNKRNGVAACDALAELARTARPTAVADGLDKGIKSSDPKVRAAAARGLSAFPRSMRASRLQKLLDGATREKADLAVSAAALEGCLRAPDPVDLPELLRVLDFEGLSDILERRAIAAVRGLVEAAGDVESADERSADDLAAVVVESLSAAGSPAASSRFARLLGLLAELPEGADEEPAEGAEAPEAAQAMVSVKPVLDGLAPAIEHEKAQVRASAAWALGRIATDEALAAAASLAKTDPDARVRLIAIQSVTQARDVTNDESFKLATDRLTYDPDLLVREEAAVALGVPVDGAVPVLEKAVLGAEASPETQWALGTCAAVSLGKTRDPAAFPILKRLRDEAKDWRLEAAAVVGLGHLRMHEAVPELIDALKSKHTAVSASAFEFLRRLTLKKVEPRTKAWKAWWEENGPGYVFPDPDAVARDAKKYGYAPTAVGVYEGLDVIVLQSRGDHIEKLLERLEVDFRLTRGGQVEKARLHPFGVFVSNCTGQINAKDIAQVQWFVRAGGYLFCSCWALHHTAELVYPGLEGYESPVRKLPTKGEVLDNVLAEPCPTRSPYLDGVFDGVTEPIYVLYGAHLIEVRDPERVEVLIDSPDCATRWGGGNLACWFRAGHGVILDSSNHFDLQGLDKAVGLKTADDRKAYAIDHMGLSYEEARRMDAAKLWNSASKAKDARDLSAFRFITNFVRQKRRQDQ